MGEQRHLRAVIIPITNHDLRLTSVASSVICLPCSCHWTSLCTVAAPVPAKGPVIDARPDSPVTPASTSPAVSSRGCLLSCLPKHDVTWRGRALSLAAVPLISKLVSRNAVPHALPLLGDSCYKSSPLRQPHIPPPHVIRKEGKKHPFPHFFLPFFLPPFSPSSRALPTSLSTPRAHTTPSHRHTMHIMPGTHTSPTYQYLPCTPRAILNKAQVYLKKMDLPLNA